MNPESSLPNHRQAVRRGLLRICLFFCIGVIAAYTANEFIERALKRVNSGEIGVWNQIVRGEINAEILISGSSRGLAHFDSRIFQQELGKETYNISLNASRADLQLARLKTYLAHNKKPEILIQSLDIHSLAITREIYDPGQFMSFLDEAPLYEALRDLEPATWKWKHVPLYGYAVEDLRYSWLYGSVEAFLGRSADSRRKKGFDPRYRKWTGEFEAFRKANPNGVIIDFEPHGVEVMGELAELCDSEGIRLILVFSPEYFEMVLLAVNRVEIFEAFNILARESDLLFINYSEHEMSKDQTNFYNSQHLNASGAKAFSLDLAMKLRSEGLGSP